MEIGGWHHLLWFYFGNGTFILCRWEKANVSELAYGNLNFFHSPIWIVGNVHIDRNRFTVMIQLRKMRMKYVKSRIRSLTGKYWGNAALTSLSRLASKWILFGFNINSLLTSIDGCSPNLDGAYIIFLIANRTEFRLCGLSSMCSPTNALSS